MKLDITQQLKFDRKRNEWTGNITHPFGSNSIELAIEVIDSTVNLIDKTKLVENVFNEYDEIMLILYRYIFERYSSTDYKKTFEEIRKMYFLCAITLKADSLSWWIVLEPNFDVPSVYNRSNIG